jgi:GAF domain-containing protein
MIAPPYPSDENERLAELYDLGVLDTGEDKVFNDLASLAAYVCKAPIALISLIDRDRQWFKAKIGIDADETPRELSFCAHAILQDGTMEVHDSLEDERFRDNPFVTSDPHVRFYAGAPLTTPKGYKLGTLCVVDRVPRDLSEGQLAALRALSGQVTSQLELRRELRVLKQKLERFQ